MIEVVGCQNLFPKTQGISHENDPAKNRKKYVKITPEIKRAFLDKIIE